MEKQFDAVIMQQNIREKLGKEFFKNHELRALMLLEIQKKYGIQK